MKTRVIIGPYIQNDIPGILSVEIEDIAPKDWATRTPPADGHPSNPPQTINEWKQQLGGRLQGYTIDPIGLQKFLLDLTPWSHLDGETHLHMMWHFKPDHPIYPTDPRHPRYHPEPYS